MLYNILSFYIYIYICAFDFNKSWDAFIHGIKQMMSNVSILPKQRNLVQDTQVKQGLPGGSGRLNKPSLLST